MITTYVILLAFTPVCNYVLNVVLARMFSNLRREASQRLAIASALGGLPFMTALVLPFLQDLYGAELERAIVYGLIVYCCLAYSYFHLFNMSETARGIKILYELQINGKLSPAEIDKRYSPQDMLKVRLARLVALKQLTEKEGRYVMKGHGFYLISKILIGWGRLLGFSMNRLEF